MKNQSGFVLLMTIFIISIMSFLVVSSMRTIFLYDKMQKKSEKASDAFYQLHDILNFLIRHRVSAKDVTIMNDDLDYLFKYYSHKELYRDKIWLYVVHNLERTPCVRVGNYEANLFWLDVRDYNQPSITLHARIATKSGNLSVCNSSELREVREGLLSLSVTS